MGKRACRRISELTASRQLVFAPKSQPLLGFHLRHLEQTDQHAEFVAPRHPRQFGDRLCNEGRGLLRPAIRRIVVSRTPVPARTWGLPPFP